MHLPSKPRPFLPASSTFPPLPLILPPLPALPTFHPAPFQHTLLSTSSFQFPLCIFHLLLLSPLTFNHLLSPLTFNHLILSPLTFNLLLLSPLTFNHLLLSPLTSHPQLPSLPSFHPFLPVIPSPPTLNFHHSPRSTPSSLLYPLLPPAPCSSGCLRAEYPAIYSNLSAAWFVLRRGIGRQPGGYKLREDPQNLIDM
ncbi:hypothetical protein Pmani_007319 [Petrolisthes manimaculis]|uniref:Uncharacterized protein n=1 Tax=Petrolisthes manimaculis TaxID=1843537 RepID=A0AAE1Q8Z8_9EUCA|nr:hypothetical protein Pmani_007319 [Petrolisthes manimaculis]